MPGNTISVTRPGKWGNPHRVGPLCDAETAVERFERGLVCGTLVDRTGRPLLTQIHELKGKDLACFCREGAPCPADVLLRLSNAA